MPAGIFALVIVNHYGGEGTVALQCILASMVVCLITTPIWLYLGVKLLPLAKNLSRFVFSFRVKSFIDISQSNSEFVVLFGIDN